MSRTLRALVRGVPRGVGLGLHVCVGIVLASLLGTGATRRAARWLTWWSRGLCRLMNVRLECCGEPLQVGCLLIANHVSWLDVFCIAAVRPTRFLAKREVARWPLIGWLCSRFGTLFIDRGSRDGGAEATRALAAALTRGETVLVFPEGTSTTGERVGRFHPRLFEAALAAQRPTQAVTVAYGAPPTHGLGRPHGPDSRASTRGSDATERVPFVGDAALVPHLVGLLGLPEIAVRLAFEAPLPPELASRDALAREAWAQVYARLRSFHPRGWSRALGAPPNPSRLVATRAAPPPPPRPRAPHPTSRRIERPG